MSAQNVSSLNFISQQVTIYLGIPILTAGVIGNTLNILVFLSLRTFRENSCAFYLTVMSFMNNGQLVTGLLTRIMISGFDVDWTESSLFYCKFRQFGLQTCVSIYMTCMCLATIDQFLATCHSRYWQQWSDIKLARRFAVIALIVWLLHGIPYWIYYDQIPMAGTDDRACVITNRAFQFYYIGIHIVALNCLLPTAVSVGFGLLAYRHVQDLAYRTIPLIRRELDKQLTSIVLIQVIFNFVAITPYIIVYTLVLIVIMQGHELVNFDQLRFANTLTICIFYLTFAVSHTCALNVPERSVCCRARSTST